MYYKHFMISVAAAKQLRQPTQGFDFETATFNRNSQPHFQGTPTTTYNKAQRETICLNTRRGLRFGSRPSDLPIPNSQCSIAAAKVVIIKICVVEVAHMPHNNTLCWSIHYSQTNHTSCIHIVTLKHITHQNQLREQRIIVKINQIFPHNACELDGTYGYNQRRYINGDQHVFAKMVFDQSIYVDLFSVNNAILKTVQN